MKAHFERRRQKLRKLVKQADAQGMLVTDVINIRYLTGFTGSSGYLLVTPREAILFSDSRYSQQIEEECPGLDYEIRTAKQNQLSWIAKRIAKLKLTELAVEAHKLVKMTFDKLAAALSSTTTLVETEGLVEQLRMIKDAHELQIIRKAVRIAERSFEVTKARLTAEQTELQVAHDMEHQIRQFGGSRFAFDPIVGVGPRAALPHGHPTEMAMGEAPFVLIDWGAQYAHYASDLTRILVTGKISRKFERVYNTVLKAQLAAIHEMRPGKKLVDIDKTARSVIEAEGFGKRFGHGLGHGFGLEIHEMPSLSPHGNGTLQPGMVVTVEPGIYIPGWGGVRIEDDILITSDGHEVLSRLPKDLDQCYVQI